LGDSNSHRGVQSPQTAKPTPFNGKRKHPQPEHVPLHTENTKNLKPYDKPLTRTKEGEDQL